VKLYNFLQSDFFNYSAYESIKVKLSKNQ